jgi:hypothetical protein
LIILNEAAAPRWHDPDRVCRQHDPDRGDRAMKIFRRFARPVGAVLVVAVATLSLHIPVADATMVGTEQVLSPLQAQQARDRIHEALVRQDIGDRLRALGVDPARVQARVDALTDEEARQLAGHLDTMPAGGSLGGVILFLFLLLLITDILGLTHVFPFTNKGSAR